MIGFLVVLFAVVVVGSFPATWLLMLFLGNVGVLGCPARRDPDDVLRRRDRRPQPVPLGHANLESQAERSVFGEPRRHGTTPSSSISSEKLRNVRTSTRTPSVITVSSVGSIVIV